MFIGFSCTGPGTATCYLLSISTILVWKIGTSLIIYTVFTTYYLLINGTIFSTIYGWVTTLSTILSTGTIFSMYT